MSDELTAKMIAALRDMAAKVDETIEREIPDLHQSMASWQQGRDTPMQTISEPRYGRDWLSGRLLGMADAIEALTAKG